MIALIKPKNSLLSTAKRGVPKPTRRLGRTRKPGENRVAKWIDAKRMKEADAKTTVVLIRYYDDKERRCAMYVQAGNVSAANELVKLINKCAAFSE